MDTPENTEYCITDVLDRIIGSISGIREKLEPVLRAAPPQGEDKKSYSLLRDKLSDILTQLNILNSRIEL